MFCSKCGAKNDDSAKFCEKCGEPLNTINSEKEIVVSIEDAKKNKKVGIISVIACAIIIAVILFIAFGGRSYEEVIDEYIDAQLSCDTESILNLYPKEIVDYIIDEEIRDNDYMADYIDRQGFIDYCNDELKDNREDLQEIFGGNLSMSYNIMEVTDVSEDFFDDYMYLYGDDYAEDYNFSGCKVVTVEIVCKGDKNEGLSTKRIHLMKSGRSWDLSPYYNDITIFNSYDIGDFRDTYDSDEYNSYLNF